MRTGFKIISMALVIILTNTNGLSEEPVSPPDIGIDEKLGEYLPLNLSFLDENSETVSLKQLLNKPTILSLVYYRCPGICNPLLGGLADVLNKLPLEPDRYNVLTISFDTQDTPAIAIEKKKNYANILKKDYPEESWRFLTGDSENINKLTDAVGFKFKKEGYEFIHPAALIILSPDGKVVRYLYGITFLPFDVGMALTEASRGKVGPTIRKTLLFCYKYDPQGRRYVLNITRLTGSVIILSVMTFFVYLLILNKIGNKRKTGEINGKRAR